MSFINQMASLEPATEVMMASELFVRRFQIRTPNLLVMPPTPLVSQFEFPRNAVYHFVAMDGVQEGPASTDPRLVTVDRKIPIEAVRALTSFIGNPVPVTMNVQSAVDTWHRQNKRFRRAKDAVSESPSDQTLAIINYAWLNRLYRYTRSIYTERYRWVNTWTTVLNKIEEISLTSGRQHFLFLDLPQQLPSMQRMEQLSGRPDQAVVRVLRNPEEWMVFELWKWLNPKTRENSLFNKLSVTTLGKVQLIIADSGRFINVDLGKLNDWLIKPDSLTSQKVRITAQDMQKRVLRGCMGLMQFRNAVVLDEETGEIDTAAMAQQEEQAANVQNVEENESTQKRAEAILLSLDDDMAQLDSFDANSLVSEVDPDSDPETQMQAITAAVSKLESHATAKPVATVLVEQADELADMGVLTAPEYRKLQKLMEKSATLPSPYDSSITLAEFSRVEPEDTVLSSTSQLPDSITLIDKSMRDASLKDFDPKYIETYLPKDVAASVHAMQKAGFIVTDYQVEKVEDVMSAFEFHTVRITPLSGIPSTLRFKLPAVDASGKIKSGGTDYRYRKQRIDLPIRKISSTQVALSSYYGKNFVSRCDKAAYDYGRWLQREVMLLTIGEAPTLSHLQTADVYNNEAVAPRAYTALSKAYKGFTKGDVVFQFDWTKLEAEYTLDVVNDAKAQLLIPCGKDASGKVYALDNDNTLYTLEDGNSTPLSSLTAFLGIDDAKTPIEFTECRIFGKNIPSGLVLGYFYGLTPLLSLLGVTPRKVSAGQRLNLQPGEWALAFEDESLIFNREDQTATLILAGLRTLDKSLKRYSVHAFDNQSVYLNVLEQAGMSVRYLRELDSLDKLFVDPITERILKRMKEPTTYRGLVKRATEMLLLDEHPRLLDARHMRWRGMERVAGAVYTEMVQATREHNAKVGKSHARIEMNPYSIWKRVMQDPAMVMVKDINPINNLKEIEAVTYTGHGGRSSRSLTRASRYFDPTEMGVTSESTSDSKDVAVNTYMVASPRFANMEGMVSDPLYAESPTSSLLSTTALVSPCSDKEDSKRTNFSSIQQSHGIACDNYFPSPVRTGFEETIAGKVDEGFASSAKRAGKIKAVNNDGILVEYDDGSTEGMSLGRRFGAASGMMLPHDMVTQFKAGDTFEQGAILVYHKGFFQPDRFNPKVVRWMNGTLARVALLESKQTHEDACSISASFAERFSTRITTPKRIVVAFDQRVRNLVEVGSKIAHSDPVCLIEDAITADRGLFSEDALNTLKTLSGQSPRSKVSGVVDHIEVYYHGDKEDMNESLRLLADKSDERLRRKRKSSGKSVYTGQVDEGYNINGDPLLMDTAVIVVYITHDVKAGIGDKLVFSNQLKSVTSEVFNYPLTTESGQEVDAIFGALSIFNRIVGSPFEIGTTNVLLNIIGRNAAAIYKGLKQQ